MPLDEAVRRVAERTLLDQTDDQGTRHWGDAVLMQGMLALYEATGYARYLDYSRRWMDAYIDHGFDASRWVWFWAGLAPPALMLYTATDDDRYRRWARRIADALMNEAPRTRVGGITPHPDRPELWVDVPFFVVPALCRVAALEGDARYTKEAVRQLQLHIRHLLDEPTGLFYHVWNEETGQRSPCLWGRGNGWLAISLLEIIGHQGHDSNDREAFSAILARQAACLASLQDRTGLWQTVLDRPDAYLETSCSAMFVYVFARGVREGSLEPRYLENARRGWAGLQEKVTAEGKVVGASMQTPPGPFEFYQSIPTGTEKFGTGLFLLAGLEMARLGP
ncbi:MAG: glycoside hydrolase family 88 protein [Chloroflexi bacterium]|nr:glycoside hydrolase family 88 protein [Chloroflexota bacterium]